VPQLAITYLAPLIVSTFGVSVATAAAIASTIGSIALTAAVSAAAYAVNALVNKTEVPKPDDGSYNLKQSVPRRAYVLGRCKKGGDYVFLEEASGVGYHVIVHAAHRIEGYVQHYLHDEAVALDTDGYVTAPTHFGSHVKILTRLGLDAETAYSDITAAFPTIWGAAHRGDGLASIMMSCATVASDSYLDVYPNQMPVHSAVLDGMRLYDPRSGETSFSTNLALMRLWHLCHPVGAKLTLADMYLPDWIRAADVCDEVVTNRSGGAERRYHGGFWFRSSNDPAQIGLIMDQAAELVVYERPDGLIGVHAGEYVAPDVRLTAADIVSCSYDANQRRASTVLAVRGRYSSPADTYTTVDAAIWGDPYQDDDSTERTKTVENVAVQSHNHCQRLQKLAMIRANAPRISVVAHYDPARQVRTRRFVRIHLPPRLDEAVIEITSAPKLSLRALTIEFSGIVVPETLYDFDAATEEGEPGATPVDAVYEGVPEPAGFSVSIHTEVVSGGQTAAFALAEWDYVAASLTYELEWEPTDASAAALSVYSKSGETSVRSTYLADGQQYRFRLRAWAIGSASDWTDDQILTATADPVAPGVATGVSGSGGSGSVTFAWTAPNSANYLAARLYLGLSATFVDATLVATEYGPAATADSRTLTGLAAGTWYGWVEAINVSGVAASAVATGPITVS
jgi:hypothetical protein